MIFFLFGQDTYRSQKKLEEITARYRKIHQSGLNLRILDIKERDFDDFKNEISFSPMFSEKKLIILKNAFSNKNFKERFLKEIEKFATSKEIILFYEEGKVEDEKFLMEIKRYGKVQEFNFLTEGQLRNWIKKEFKDFGRVIREDAIEELIERVGNDLWQMLNEIKKLVNYSQEKVIEKKDVRLLVSPKIERDIFKTINAVALKDKKMALQLLKNHLDKGEKVVYLLAMIKYQFKNLLVVKDLMERKIPFFTILKITQLKMNVLRKTLELAKKFEISELKNIYQKIFETDLAIKTGKVEPEVALELLIAEI